MCLHKKCVRNFFVVKNQCRQQKMYQLSTLTQNIRPVVPCHVELHRGDFLSSISACWGKSFGLFLYCICVSLAFQFFFCFCLDTLDDPSPHMVRHGMIITTQVFLVIGLLFTFINIVFTVVNIAHNPVSAIVGIDGLVAWNIIAGTIIFGYLSQTATQYK